MSDVLPTITNYNINRISTFEASSDLHTNAHRLHDTRPLNIPPPSTTASQQQTWLPPSAAPRRPPQPVFSQDFELFQPTATPTQAPPASSHRAHSLDSTLHPSFNTASPAAFHANGQYNSAHKEIDSTHNRSTRPPVPLFHSNSTGNLGNQQFQQQVTDITNFAMGGGDVNVAYDGTFGDLSAAGAAEFFDVSFDNDSTNMDYGFMTAGDSFTSINGGGNAGTISPKDLFNDSVPPSTSFTNLTTPGSTILHTPDDYQTSPLFNDNMEVQQDDWFPLFPGEGNDAPVAPKMERTPSNQVVIHPGGVSNHRKRSSTSTSPNYSPAVKASQVAGVGARKRDKPLPPIIVDEEDAVAVKRARNTAAARKSRAKKVAERDQHETIIAAQQAELQEKDAKIARLEAQVERLLANQKA